MIIITIIIRNHITTIIVITFTISITISTSTDTTTSTTTTSTITLKSRADANMTTRAASRGEITSIWAKSKLYYDSFLPQTIGDLRVTKN